MPLRCCHCATPCPVCFCSNGEELGAQSATKLIERPVSSTSVWYGLSSALPFVQSTPRRWRKDAHSAVRHYRRLQRIRARDTALRAAVGSEHEWEGRGH